MRRLTVIWEDRPGTAALEARLDRHGRVLVPLQAFCATLQAEVRRLVPDGPSVVCQGDLCVPLDPSETVELDGALHGHLDALGLALGIGWEAQGDAVRVRAAAPDEVAGLGIGARAPDFTLPDLNTRDSVSLRDFRGKPAVFYMWASW